jgi:hypothetical protein
VNKVLRDLLWVGAVIVVPGLGLALLIKALASDASEKQKFREYVKKTYGKYSEYVERL